MRYALSLLLFASLLPLSRPPHTEGDELFRDMEKKIKAAKAFEVTYSYQVENRKTRGELLLTNDNKVRLKVSGHVGDKRNAAFEVVSDGKKLISKGAKLFVAPNGQSG